VAHAHEVVALGALLEAQLHDVVLGAVALLRCLRDERVQRCRDAPVRRVNDSIPKKRNANDDAAIADPAHPDNDRLPSSPAAAAVGSRRRRRRPSFSRSWLLSLLLLLLLLLYLIVVVGRGSGANGALASAAATAEASAAA